jgi:hypothetical protein
MITGVRGATIWSEYLNRLLPFYRDVLGLPVAIDTPGFVVLGRRDSHTLALGTHSEVRGKNADPARHMVGLTSDDIMADCKRLKDARASRSSRIRRITATCGSRPSRIPTTIYSSCCSSETPPPRIHHGAGATRGGTCSCSPGWPRARSPRRHRVPVGDEGPSAAGGEPVGTGPHERR